MHQYSFLANGASTIGKQWIQVSSLLSQLEWWPPARRTYGEPTPQREQWNSGIMGSGMMQCWINCPATGGIEDKINMVNILLKTNNPSFHPSIIPFSGQIRRPQKTSIFSVGCRNSETLNHMVIPIRAKLLVLMHWWIFRYWSCFDCNMHSLLSSRKPAPVIFLCKLQPCVSWK